MAGDKLTVTAQGREDDRSALGDLGVEEEAGRENQGELLEARAQLKCPKGHVRVSVTRRQRRDIPSRGKSAFRGTQVRQRTPGASSLRLKVGGVERVGKGWNK